MIQIINCNKLPVGEINKAAVIKHPDFLATVVKLDDCQDKRKDQSVCPAEIDLNERKWGEKSCVWKLNTQGLTHVNQGTVYVPHTGEAPIDSLLQTGKPWKTTTIWQKSESKTKEVGD